MNPRVRTRMQPRQATIPQEKVEMKGSLRNAAKAGKGCSKERQLALQQDVDRLKEKLRHEENIHRALERAFNRPLGALPRLPPYLPPYLLGLLAEVALLEEEIVRLEEKVVHIRQDLYQQAVYISSSTMNMEHSACLTNPNPMKSPKLDKLKSLSQIPGNPATSATRPTTTLQEDGQGKENQSCAYSSKRKQQSTQMTKNPIEKIPNDNKLLKNSLDLPKRQQKEARVNDQPIAEVRILVHKRNHQKIMTVRM